MTKLIEDINSVDITSHCSVIIYEVFVGHNILEYINHGKDNLCSLCYRKIWISVLKKGREYIHFKSKTKL